MNTMSRGWTAALAAAILATLAALAIVGVTRAQSVSSLTVGSATVAPGEQVTISITANVSQLGAWGINVEYDASLVSADSCTGSTESGVVASCSIDAVAPNTVRVNGASLDGISGDVVLGTITFTAGDTEGVAALTVATGAALTLAGSDANSTPLSVTPTNGAITIAEATPTPEPTVDDTTPAPTATPGGLPATGDGWTASTTSSMIWLLAAAGMVIAAAGAWVLARNGREN
ncbi:MAG TPA: cohesin domain-containing protein, partial [Dehalococcoidia bacterium]|nr:cohesin domain-containing protein [Dehalococcoidia bacterium]